MNKTKVIVSVRGGLVTQVCSNNPDIDVSVLDYDNFSQGDEPSREQRRNMKLAEKARPWKPECEFDNNRYTAVL
jgi:hypothetical protein